MSSASEYLLNLQNPRYYGEYSESGVDIGLIKYMLSLPPLERVQMLERRAREYSWIRENVRPCRKARPSQARPVVE